MFSFVIGYILGIFSLAMYSMFKISSEMSRKEGNEEIEIKEFNEKYNLGKEFCNDNKENDKIWREK